jgi:signal transduction histidine kinase
MDIQLSERLDEISAAQQIYSRFDIPVVYLCAPTDEEALQRAKMTEPFDYITKPVERRELYAVLEMVPYKHRMERQQADLLAMLTHDIRSVLAAILGYSELVQEEGTINLRQEACLNSLQRRVQSTLLLVNNWLEHRRH